MTTLNVAALREQGAFTGAPVAKELSWTTLDGQTLTGTVYVRQASYATVTEQWKANAAEKDGTAARIANMIVDENGTPIFTLEDITGSEEHGPLSEALTVALLNAIGEVNRVNVPEGEEKK